MCCQNKAMPVAVELEEERKQSVKHAVDGQDGDTAARRIHCHHLLKLDKGFCFVQAIKTET